MKKNTFSKKKLSKRILVTGGGGYIGSCVVEKLLNEGYKVIVFDKFFFGRYVFNDLKHRKNLALIEGDIRDKTALIGVLKDVYAVIHLAGIVGDMACSVDESVSRQINIEGTVVLKDQVKLFAVEKFLFASSCSVYGITHAIVDEKSTTNPLSIYAKTKIEAEKILLEDRTETFHPTVLRFTTVFGHSRKPRFDLVANLFIANAYNDGKIHVLGGNQWRPFIHVRDIANAISVVLESSNDKINRQIFNIGDDDLHLKITDLALAVKEIVTDKNIQIIITPNPLDKRDYRVSFQKVKKLLGFTASVSMQEGLTEMYDNFKKNKYKLPISDPYYSSLQTEKAKMK